MEIAKKYYLKRLAADIYASGINLAERFPEWITLMYSMAGGGKDLLDSFLNLASPDCHRIKTSGAQWMGWLMRYKLKGADGKFLLSQDWHATPCLFGQHLLSSLSLVCLVEAEKTAVILSQLMSDKLWLASGGEQALSVDKLAALQGHKVILYPDTDPDGATFAHWQQIATDARRQLGLDISISNLLESHASAEQKERKIDLVDFLIESEELGKTFSPEVISMIGDNPAMQDLIDTFDLVELNSN